MQSKSSGLPGYLLDDQKSQSNNYDDSAQELEQKFTDEASSTSGIVGTVNEVRSIKALISS